MKYQITFTQDKKASIQDAINYDEEQSPVLKSVIGIQGWDVHNPQKVVIDVETEDIDVFVGDFKKFLKTSPYMCGKTHPFDAHLTWYDYSVDSIEKG